MGAFFQMGDRERLHEQCGCCPGHQTESVLLSMAEAEPSQHFLTSGLAVDYHNERLYWADAKLSVIGSIRLDGTDPVVAADGKRGQRMAAVWSLTQPLGLLPFLLLPSFS